MIHNKIVVSIIWFVILLMFYACWDLITHKNHHILWLENVIIAIIAAGIFYYIIKKT